METQHGMTRRGALGLMAGAAGALSLNAARAAAQTPETAAALPALKGRVRQSVSRWCLGKMKLEDLCVQGKAIGLQSIELLNPDEWVVVKEHGLTCAMANGPSGINRGWNRAEDHDMLVKKSEELMPKAAELGLPNMIALSGSREGISDDEGLANCAKGLKRIMPLAEKLNLTICMELLNSKRDHKGYQCDRTAWGVELAKRVESDRFKLLYDIYHMQIMEGDVIATLQENINYIGHIHTGGVPGRNEIDETQELNYRRIVQALFDAGYTGFIGHEFVPKRDPMTSLRQAIEICDI